MVDVADVVSAQKAWGEGIVAIANAHMNGGDYVLDAIAEMEMPPAFPKNEGRHPFLVSIDHSKGQLPLIVDTEMLLREGGDPR